MFAVFDKVYNSQGEILAKVKYANGIYLVQLAYDQPIVIHAKHEILFRVPLRDFHPCRVLVVGSYGFYHIVSRRRHPILRIHWLGCRNGGKWHVVPLRDHMYFYRQGTYLYLRPQV